MLVGVVRVVAVVAEVVYELELEPTGLPFKYHWNEIAGSPPSSSMTQVNGTVSGAIGDADGGVILIVGGVLTSTFKDMLLDDGTSEAHALETKQSYAPSSPITAAAGAYVC